MVSPLIYNEMRRFIRDQSSSNEAARLLFISIQNQEYANSEQRKRLRNVIGKLKNIVWNK